MLRTFTFSLNNGVQQLLAQHSHSIRNFKQYWDDSNYLGRHGNVVPFHLRDLYSYGALYLQVPWNQSFLWNFTHVPRKLRDSVIKQVVRVQIGFLLWKPVLRIHWSMRLALWELCSLWGKDNLFCLFICFNQFLQKPSLIFFFPCLLSSALPSSYLFPSSPLHFPLFFFPLPYSSLFSFPFISSSFFPFLLSSIYSFLPSFLIYYEIYFCKSIPGAAVWSHI